MYARPFFFNRSSPIASGNNPKWGLWGIRVYRRDDETKKEGKGERSREICGFAAKRRGFNLSRTFFFFFQTFASHATFALVAKAQNPVVPRDHDHTSPWGGRPRMFPNHVSVDLRFFFVSPLAVAFLGFCRVGDETRRDETRRTSRVARAQQVAEACQ
jgi:hypothetical protein